MSSVSNNTNFNAFLAANGSGNTANAPDQLMNDVYAVWFILQGGLGAFPAPANPDGSQSGQQQMQMQALAQAINNLAKYYQANPPSSTTSKNEDGYLNSILTQVPYGQTQSLAALCASISSAAAGGTVDTADIATLLAQTQPDNYGSPMNALVNCLTDPNQSDESHYYFNEQHTYTYEGTNEAQFEADISAAEAATDPSSSNQIYQGIFSGSNQKLFGQIYAKDLMAVYTDALNSGGPVTNGYASVILSYFNAPITVNGTPTTLHDILSAAANPNGMTDAQLAALQNVLEFQGGGTTHADGTLNSLMASLLNSDAIFQNITSGTDPHLPSSSTPV